MNPLLPLPTGRPTDGFRRPVPTGPLGFPPAGAPGPAALPGLVLWLDADRGVSTDVHGARVHSWADQSGNFGAVTQSTNSSRPLFDRLRRTVGPDSTNAPTPQLPISGLSFNRRNFSAFFVCDRLACVFGNALLHRTAGDSCNLLIQATGGDAGKPGVTGSGGSIATNLYSRSSRTLYGFVGSPTGLTIWRNADAQRFPALTAGVSTLTHVGCSAFTAAGVYKDIIYYNRALTDDEVTRTVLPYAYSRGCPSQVRALVLTDGDSITYGRDAVCDVGWSRRLQFALPSSVVHVGTGRTGAEIPTLASSAATQVDVFKLAAGVNVMTFWAGTNDIANGADGTTTYNNYVAYCQARQAAGWKVVAFTMLRRTAFDATMEGYRAAFNANVLANYATFADAVCDVGADARFTPPSQWMNGTHPLDPGEDVILNEYAKPAVQSLIGF